jgi:hypothetical protein
MDYDSEVDDIADEQREEWERGRDEQQLVPGIGQYQHVAAREDYQGEIIGGTGELRRWQRLVWRMDLDPVQKFSYLLDKYINQYNEIFRLNDGDIQNIQDSVDKVSNPNYKNPIAYILGYMAITNNTINPQKLDSIENIIPKVAADIVKVGQNTVVVPFVTKTDVIRYARYWILHVL